MFRTLQRKVAFGIAMLVAVVGLTLGLSMLQATGLQQALRHVTTEVVPALNAHQQFNTTMAKAIGDVTTLVFLGLPQEQAEAEASLVAARDALAYLDAHPLTTFTAPGATADPEEAALQAQRRAAVKAAAVLLQDASQGGRLSPMIVSLDDLDRAIVDLTPASERVYHTAVARMTERVERDIQQFTRTNLGMFAIFVLLAIAPWFLIRRLILRPVQLLAAANAALTAGDLSQQVTVTSDDEIGILQRSFNELSATLRAQRAELTQQVAAARAAQATAEAAQAQVAEQLTTIQQQHATIRDMSIPILPVTDSLLVVPLVGTLDEGRMAYLQERVLREIERRRAGLLLIDVTGVPVIDSTIADGLMQVVRAANLLGSRITLVGIRPEVAEALVTLGIDLRDIHTHATLQGGLQGTLQTIVRAPTPAHGEAPRRSNGQRD